MIEYVVGFLFRPTGWVLLLEKARPEWQRGKLNGLGGKIEPGETPLEAMVREFSEESGAVVTDWRRFATLHCREARVHFFVSHEDVAIAQPPNADERAGWYDVDTVCSGTRVIPNLRWLLRLAQDPDGVFAAVTDPS